MGNDHFCDTTKRASQRLTLHIKKEIPTCITEVVGETASDQPCSRLPLINLSRLELGPQQKNKILPGEWKTKGPPKKIKKAQRGAHSGEVIPPSQAEQTGLLRPDPKPRSRALRPPCWSQRICPFSPVKLRPKRGSSTCGAISGVSPPAFGTEMIRLLGCSSHYLKRGDQVPSKW